MRLMRVLVAVFLASGLLAVALPAQAETARVDDAERFEVAGVALSKARFTYGEKRVRVIARYSYLAKGAVDQYQLELRGRHGRVWKVGWSPTDHSRFFTTFLLPGESADRVKCKVRWRESFAKQQASVSFPTRCLRLGQSRPPKRLRMGLSAEDFGQSYLFDSAPGGNSVVGGAPKVSRWIRRG